jgi:hypothetical protein
MYANNARKGALGKWFEARRESIDRTTPSQSLPSRYTATAKAMTVQSYGHREWGTKYGGREYKARIRTRIRVRLAGQKQRGPLDTRMQRSRRIPDS